MLSKLFSLAGTDGCYHIIVCATAVGILKQFMPLWLAMLIVMVVAIAKEVVYDKWMKKGKCEWKDIVCDVVGCAIGAL